MRLQHRATPAVHAAVARHLAALFPQAAAILFLSATTTLADPPALSPERFLSGDASAQSSVDVQEQSRIAAGGPGYLVVWEDRRSVLSGWVNIEGPLNGNGIDIYGMRLDQNGDPLDASPILICQEGRNQTKPQVAWNEAAQAWLVVWTTQRPDWYFFQDIVGARVSASGEVLDATPIPLRPEANNPANNYAEYPTIASDGNQWVVAWTDILWQGDRGYPNVAAKRVNAAGTVLDPNPVVLYQHPDNVFGPIMPHLAWAADEYLLVWERAGFYDIVGKRIDAGLQTIGPSSFLITESGYGPRVATDGTDFLVSTRFNKVHRVTHAGVSLDPAGIALNAPATSDRGPDVTWNGNAWCVVNAGWQALRNKIWLSRISTGGTILSTSVIQDTGNDQFGAGIASRGDGTAEAVWEERHASLDYLENIRGSRIDAGGNGAPARDLSIGLRRQSHVRFARNGNEVLAVFISQGGGTTKILAQRLDGDGNAIDAEPTEVASVVETLRDVPSVAWNGAWYVVAWAHNGSIYARRLDAEAGAVDPSPVLLLTDAASFPAVGALDSSVLLAYIHTYSGDQNFLKGVRLDAATMTLIGSPAFLGPGFVIPDVQIAAFRGRWFVVYEDQGNHDVSASLITGVFVAADGAPSEAFSISTSFNDDQPGLAVAADRALVTWINVNQYASPAVEGRLVNANAGFVTSPFLVADPPGQQFRTSAAWDGDQFVVAWTDFRDLAAIEQLRGDVYAARIDAGGTVLDPGGFQVTEGALPEDLPAVTAGNGKAIIAYCRMSGVDGPEVQRIGTRILGINPAGVDGAVEGIASGWSIGPVPFTGRLVLANDGGADATQMQVFSLDGRLVFQAPLDGGARRLTWDGRDDHGNGIAAGAYFVRLLDGSRVLCERRVVRVD